jgi:hypothetical protein
MRFNLATLTRRAINPRRTSIPMRTINPPAVMATDLYRSAYLPVVQAWEGAVDRIMAEYERTLVQMTLDAPADVEAQIGYVERELQRLYLELTPRFRSWVYRVERWFRGKWVGATLAATGVNIDTLIGPGDVQETLDAVIGRNVALIKDVGQQAKGRISDAVFRGLTNRTPAREVAAEIRDAVDMSRRRSLGIASHQLSALSESLADERRRQAGLSVWEWMHSFKKHPRQEHVARNGNLYSDDPEMVGKVVNGKTILAPPADRPAQLPFCGCRGRAVLVFP